MIQAATQVSNPAPTTDLGDEECMKATSTDAPWRYTCTFSHLSNLDTHHLKEHIAVAHLSGYGSDFYTCTFGHFDSLDTHHFKEHIAVTHLMRVKYRYLQFSLGILTGEAMIHHRPECPEKCIELP
ncbi:unnamed protein product, partial [Mesorhabditis belari]|uniref:Uncharacterized protein n=1 Tax=Mesorhabditis belari TaxID=2138241 RepID=A0AAF3J558_9BILA